jgi:hypothetical protein
MFPRAPAILSYTNLKIYVSGFPSQTCNYEIESYFSWFGEVRVVKGGNPSYQNTRSIQQEQISAESFLEHTPKKNYIVLSCEDSRTKESILNHKDHEYYGCAIFCSDFKSGVELIIHNQQMNQKRCILRKVPLAFSREEVSEAICGLAGPIESLYVYEPLKKREVIRHYSVSITFRSRRSLTDLLSAAEEGIFFLGQRISVEKYYSKKKESMDGIFVTNSTWLSLPPSEENVGWTAPVYMNQKSNRYVCSIAQIPIMTIHDSKPSQRKYHKSNQYRVVQNHTRDNLRLNPSPF